MTIAGTRPEIIKLVPVVHALHREDGVDVRVCHSGQHVDLGREILNAAGIVPEEMLERPDAADVADLLAGLVVKVGAAIDRQRPDAVVVQGDTATSLAGALAAFHRQIPVAHVEAGLRSGDLSRPWPEEGYRKLIATIARRHFAPTGAARDALLAEGVAADTIHMVGNTVVDALHWADGRIDADPTLGRAAEPLSEAAEGRALVLATIHRRETGPDALKAIAAGLLAMVEREDVHLVLPLHPRPQSQVLRELLGGQARISLSSAVDYFAFVRLMRAARLIVSDSGGIQEEATAMGRPVLVLRETTERPEAVMAGTAKIVGHDADALFAAARLALAQPMPGPNDVFGDGHAGRRIAQRLARDLINPNR
ncbi:UDP-N-acetylglucosamine 2-epimerase (non-hydrolyzing) [Croceicoccus ponticola]|uniref:UDP-N-acetylglucosamine 2-epimerase (non-hydrolyzing) n=1 Tax=Croceicoccus ponticola TaxID=2217664 RepID=A0A437GYW1_9SPHN|nr:UDP-N-acetylglucosamine 2-epimerase (non-hydrolyzing) [Croceicoccus ponticola]RVQ67877.1 UDP-N-acetylglucosamine 2-epimerase (non-hydrolyzing) [Croceicoccus ponticola]